MSKRLTLRSLDLPVTFQDLIQTFLWVLRCEVKQTRTFWTSCSPASAADTSLQSACRAAGLRPAGEGQTAALDVSILQVALFYPSPGR